MVRRWSAGSGFGSLRWGIEGGRRLAGLKFEELLEEELFVPEFGTIEPL
jgi:hypothetical protein